MENKILDSAKVLMDKLPFKVLAEKLALKVPQTQKFVPFANYIALVITVVLVLVIAVSCCSSGKGMKVKDLQGNWEGKNREIYAFLSDSMSMGASFYPAKYKRNAGEIVITVHKDNIELHYVTRKLDDGTVEIVTPSGKNVVLTKY